MGQITLVLGGARSGKSTIAEKIAACYDKVLYVATAEAGDGEMALRIARHRAHRPAHWETAEESVEVADLVSRKGDSFDAVLIDCLTLLTSNWLFLPEAEKASPEEQVNKVLGRVEGLLEAVEKTMARVIIVSNEVGLSIVPANSISRQYRDIAGLANQAVAKRAEKVIFTVAGIPLDLKKMACSIEDEEA